MPPCGKFSPVKTVPARPVQIRAHHHMDVNTEINEGKCKGMSFIVASPVFINDQPDLTY